MRRVTILLLAAALAALAAPPAAAKRARATERFPRSEAAAVRDIERRLAERRYTEADSLAGELVRRAESGRGAVARMLPEALWLQAEVLRQRGRPNDPEFLAAAERAVAALAADADPARRAASLELLGIARLRRLDAPGADSVLTVAVALRDGASPRDERALGIALGWLAEARRAAKKLADAEDAARRALAVLEAGAPDEIPARVRAHATLGNAAAERGQPDDAARQLERALALETARDRPDSTVIGVTLRSLGRAHTVAGRHHLAIATYERAVAVQERTLGPEHAEVATTLYLLSYMQSQGGDFVAARRSADRAVRIREQVFGPDHSQTAVALWQVGGAQRELGDLAGALRTFERAVAILRAASPPAPADLATGLSNLAATRIAAGDGRGAREAFHEAIAIRETVFGPGAGRGFWMLSRLGQALLLEGRSREAEALLDSLLAGSSRRTPYDEADAREWHGIAAAANGALDRAHHSFDRALAVHDSALGVASPRTLESLALRAAARWALERRGEAFADALRHEQAAVGFVRAAARGLAEHEAMSFESQRASGRDILLELAADSTGLEPADRIAVFDAVVRSRLAVLDELADESRAVPRDDLALAPLVAELEAARTALAAAMVAALREGRAPDSAAAAARARREAAERALAERSDAFRAVVRRSRAEGAEVMAALPRHSALISYVRYHGPHRILAAGTPPGRSGSGARYLALLLRAGQTFPSVIPLGNAVEIEPIVERWMAAISNPPPPAAAAAAQRRADAIGRAIRAQLWDPVAKHVPDAERVFVVPDGVIHRVNFAALPDTAGGYLVESGPLIHRLAAERDLLPWGDAPRGDGLLALGGVDFEAEPGAPDGAPPGPDPGLLAAGVVVRSAIPDSLRVRFTPLPQTAAEAEEVAGRWRRAGLGEPLLLTGAAASEAAFKREAPGRRVLHLATHGFALGAPAARAAPGTRAIGGVGSGERPAARRAAALLPGLALAGANAAPAPGAEDGFLTAEEITALDLARADWAVLSACETGRSDPDAIEAVQGLHRSFRRAGVRTVIMSLWPVDDAATRAWMKRLYEARLERRTDTATAVREASRTLLAARRAQGLDLHPFHWAAFVAAGDWR